MCSRDRGEMSKETFRVRTVSDLWAVSREHKLKWRSLRTDGVVPCAVGQKVDDVCVLGIAIVRDDLTFDGSKWTAMYACGRVDADRLNMSRVKVRRDWPRPGRKHASKDIATGCVHALHL